MLLRTSRKVIKWVFVLTLPLTILPLINGITCGIYYLRWKDNIIDQNIDAHLDDIKEFSKEDWGVPGFTFRDFQDRNNDFHLLRLNSNDWSKKLGFVLPREYGDLEYNKNTPLNKIYSLDALMFDTQCPGTYKTPPKEQWVYIADRDWMLWDPWDKAFIAAVEAGYVPSRLNETELYFVACDGTAKFLCGIWGVRRPTLLHFLVEDEPPKEEDIDAGLQYSTDLQNLRPVTVRVIEFPLKDTYTGLPSNVFPGHEDQMLAIMRGDRLYEQFEPWQELTQEFKRFGEYMERLYEREGTFLYYIGKSVDWVADHFTKSFYLNAALDFVAGGSFILTAMVAGTLVWRPFHGAKEAILNFLGYPRRREWILGDGSSEKGNTWDDWMGSGGGFWDSFAEQLGQANLEKAWPSGQITTDLLSEATQATESSARTTI